MTLQFPSANVALHCTCVSVKDHKMKPIIPI